MLAWITAITAVCVLPLTVYVLAWRERGTTKAMLDHMAQVAAVGGLPKELWEKQHELREKQLELQRQQFEIDAPMRQAQLQHKLNRARTSGTRNYLNPEA